MKKTIALTATILSLLIAEAAPARPPVPEEHPAPEEFVERRVDRMTEVLDLTAEQQEQIQAILEQQRSQRAQQRAAVRAEIDAVLTPEQRTKRDAEIEKLIDRQVARIADRLDLTSEQQSAVKSVFTEKRDNPNLSPAQMRERLASVLTEDQLAELDAMRPHGGPRGRGRFGGDFGGALDE